MEETFVFSSSWHLWFCLCTFLSNNAHAALRCRRFTIRSGCVVIRTRVMPHHHKGRVDKLQLEDKAAKDRLTAQREAKLQETVSKREAVAAAKRVEEET